VAAGQTLVFPAADDPFVVRAKPPVGRGLAVVVVTRTPLGLDALAHENGRLAPVTDVGAYYGRLDIVLRGRAPINPIDGHGDWAMAEAAYLVTQ
jgi:hypothetical protein